MKWYYQIKGSHAHVRVYMNGAKCGELTFRVEELIEIRINPHISGFIKFIEGTP